MSVGGCMEERYLRLKQRHLLGIRMEDIDVSEEAIGQPKEVRCRRGRD